MLEIIRSQKVTPPNPFQALDAELADIEPGEEKEIVVKPASGEDDVNIDQERFARRAGMALRAFARARWGTAGVIGFEILEEGIKFFVRRTRARRKAASAEEAS